MGFLSSVGGIVGGLIGGGGGGGQTGIGNKDSTSASSQDSHNVQTTDNHAVTTTETNVSTTNVLTNDNQQIANQGNGIAARGNVTVNTYAVDGGLVSATGRQLDSAFGAVSGAVETAFNTNQKLVSGVLDANVDVARRVVDSGAGVARAGLEAAGNLTSDALSFGKSSLDASGKTTAGAFDVIGSLFGRALDAVTGTSQRALATTADVATSAATGLAAVKGDTGARTAQSLPWIVGGLVAVAGLFLLFRRKG